MSRLIAFPVACDSTHPNDLSGVSVWLFRSVETAVVAGVRACIGSAEPRGVGAPARNGQVNLAEPGWAYRVAQRDLQDVRDADALLAIVNGTPPDEGVMVELGAAIALGKPTFLFRDDFRRCTDSEQYPLNLMLFAGLPEQDWEDYVYNDLAELGDPRKAMARWASS